MPKRRGRKKGRLYPEIKSKLVKTLGRYPGASTNELAIKSNIGWATSAKYLRTLKREKKVKSRKRGNKTIWYI